MMTGLNHAHIPLLALCAATPLLADMPRYDVAAHCKEVASFGGDYSATLYNGCFDMEQSAYDGLKPQWDSLPGSMQRHCDDVASFADAGSYSLLQGCVAMENSAASQSKSFKY